MPDHERTFTDEELDRAVAALSDPERFREAEARVARVAPQLQRILNEALHSGGWFGEAHEEAGAEGGDRRRTSRSAPPRCGRCWPRRRAWGCSWGWRWAGSSHS